MYLWIYNSTVTSVFLVVIIFLFSCFGSYAQAMKFVPVPEEKPFVEHDDAALIDHFYAQRSGRPVWVYPEGGINEDARALLNALEKSWQEGLNPHHYHVLGIRQILDDDQEAAMVDSSRRYDLEVMLTRNFILYVRDMSGMRVDATVLGLSTSDWRQPPSVRNVLDELAAYEGRIEEFLDALEPKGVSYRALKEELVRLSKQEKSPLRDEKMGKIIVNLERQRWFRPQNSKRFIAVNIPAATLWAVEDGKVVYEMPVVVGLPKRQTPSQITYAVGVRFNPSWTVPPTVMREDILPKLKQNHAYLNDKGIELYSGYEADAHTIDPASVDWDSISQNEISGIRMVQVPGKHNPLGRIRVLMPNRQDIYLHDTNEKWFFNQENRAVSSGCVRVSEPESIARFILKSKKGWSDKKMYALLQSGETEDIYVQEKIPVYFLYFTAWLDENGKIVFGHDVYGNDKKLQVALDRLDDVRI